MRGQEQRDEETVNPKSRREHEIAGMKWKEHIEGFRRESLMERCTLFRTTLVWDPFVGHGHIFTSKSLLEGHEPLIGYCSQPSS